MDKDRLNQWLTLGANFGVLVGILLLILELEQNREMMRAQTRNEIASEIVGLLSQVATSDDLSSLLSRAASGEPFSDEDRMQFLHRALAMFRYFENVHYQYRQGMYDEEEYQAQRDAWRHNGGFLSNPAYKSVWCAWRETFSVEFRTEYESLFNNLTC